MVQFEEGPANERWRGRLSWWETGSISFPSFRFISIYHDLNSFSSHSKFHKCSIPFSFIPNLMLLMLGAKIKSVTKQRSPQSIGQDYDRIVCPLFPLAPYTCTLLLLFLPNGRLPQRRSYLSSPLHRTPHKIWPLTSYTHSIFTPHTCFHSHAHSKSF